MQVLFIINAEVERRALMPVFDLLLSKNATCRILKTPFAVQCMRQHEAVFLDESSAKGFGSDFVISANPIQEHEFNGQRAAIHHGSMFGNNAWSLNIANHSDIYFGLSAHEYEYIQTYLKETFTPERFVASGNPANDPLLQYARADAASKDVIRQELGLRKKRTLMLSSHWTSLGNFRRFGTALIDALTWNFPDDEIICTCHPLLRLNPKNEFHIDKVIATPYFESDWLIACLQSKAAHNPNIKLNFDEANLGKLLSVTDVFIGDNSSLLAEASFFDMPLLANVGGAYFNQKISRLVAEDVHAFASVEELIGTLKSLERLDPDRIKTGKKIKELFMHNVGSAAQTIVETLTAIHLRAAGAPSPEASV